MQPLLEVTWPNTRPQPLNFYFYFLKISVVNNLLSLLGKKGKVKKQKDLSSDIVPHELKCITKRHAQATNAKLFSSIRSTRLLKMRNYKIYEAAKSLTAVRVLTKPAQSFSNG